jgi:hypothetical protein
MNGPSVASAKPRALVFLTLLGLYGLGIAHWMWFFNSGDLTFQAYDWPKERLYFMVLRDALKGGRIPYHVEVPATYAHITKFPQLNNFNPEQPPVPPVVCRFLALPETVLSPQVVLLALLDVGPFVLVHILLLYSLGFLGSLIMKKRYGLSLIPFAAFFLLFNFNGYITSRLTAGHSMWSGYFLLPFFGLYILEWLESGSSGRAPLMLALVLFGMWLQGSLHLVTWCGMFTGLIAVFNWRLVKGAMWALAFSGLLLAYRLIPAAIAYWRSPRLPFGGGYPTLTDLLDGLIVIRAPSFPWIGGLFVEGPWWEYDIFIGILGLVMLVYFGIYRRLDQRPNLRACQFPCLDLPLLVLSLLSLDGFYAVIYHLPLPFLNGERVTSRFIIIPLVMLLLIACIRMQRVLEPLAPNARRSALLIAAILVTGTSLLTHSDVWRIVRWESEYNLRNHSSWHDLKTASLIEQADPVYTLGVNLSVGLTVAALVAWTYLWWRAGPTERVLNRSQ